MGARSPAICAALVASLLWPAAGRADHVSIHPSVSAEVTKLHPSSATVKVTANLDCTGTTPQEATYGGRLDLVDIETGEVIYLGDVFGATDVSEYDVGRIDRERLLQPKLSRAYCYDQIEGVFHGSGMVEVTGNVVVIPPKGADDGGGGGGGGGGGSGGGAPDDPIGPGGCANELIGTARGDVLEGDAGGDLILALAGADRVRGRAGHDCLIGGPGRDRLLGEDGYDRLTGGGGADRLDGGPGRNAYDAGSGDDRVQARNGQRETVRCGPGKDSVQADRNDRLRGCERVA